MKQRIIQYEKKETKKSITIFFIIATNFTETSMA